MGQRLYFDLTNGQDLIRDTEGVEAELLGEALEDAHSALTEMRRSGEADTPSDGWQLIVRDESGMTLGSMPLDAGSFH